MATSPLTGLSVDQWLELPEDQRSELVEGELVVSPSPSIAHARAVRNMFRVLDSYARRAGGEAFVALDGDRIEVHVRGDDGRYAAPTVRGRGEVAISTAPAGFTVRVDEVLPRDEDRLAPEG